MGVPAARVVFPAEDRAEVAAAVAEILATGSLTLGPHTKRFEAAFAAAHEAPHAVAVSSGTAALHIMLSVAGVRGRAVIKLQTQLDIERAGRASMAQRQPKA